MFLCFGMGQIEIMVGIKREKKALELLFVDGIFERAFLEKNLWGVKHSLHSNSMNTTTTLELNVIK